MPVISSTSFGFPAAAFVLQTADQIIDAAVAGRHLAVAKLFLAVRSWRKVNQNSDCL